MIKVLLVGASSFLGRAIYHGLSREKDIRTKGTRFTSAVDESFEILDITSEAQIAAILEKEEPSHILWVAGNKNLKKCQEDYDFAYRINTRPVSDLIASLKKYNLTSKVIFISTDYVFDGKRGGYEDTDIVMPVTNYGKTNALAENILMNSDIDFKIIRTAAVMGMGGQFFDWLVKVLLRGEEISLYTNVTFSPTPMNLFVEAIIDMIRNYSAFRRGVFHLVGDKSMSRYDFGVMVAGILGSKSVLIPSRVDFSSTLFQKNLSLSPSSCMEKYYRVSLRERIFDEISAYTQS
jgi:dTDP-4-dehydrorhamnose reductase